MFIKFLQSRTYRNHTQEYKIYVTDYCIRKKFMYWYQKEKMTEK